MRWNAWPEAALAMLAACSLEAAWITLAYVTIQGLARVPAPLTIVAFAGAAFIGTLGVRWLTRHPGLPDRTPLAAIVVVAALIGWLAPLGTDAVHVFDEPVALLELHPGGILVGLAVLRGAAHVTRDDDERIADLALGPGLAAVAAAWVVLTASGATREPATVGPAFSATLTFVTAGLLGIGLARSANLGGAATGRADWRTRVGPLVAVVGVLLAVSIPLAVLLEVPLDNAVRGVLGPVGEILVALVTVFLWPAGLVAAALTVLLTSLLGDPTGSSTPGDPVNPGVDLTALFGQGAAEGLVLGALPLILAIVVLFLLVRGLLRRIGPSDIDAGLDEIHEIERPEAGLRLRLPRLALPHRHAEPRDASEAYLASLDVLSRRPDAARLGWETPAEHARRLRDDPVGPALGRLAADYALAEFARRSLTPSEHRRAIERWRRIRSTRDR
jgi:hypothetical protein